MTDFKKITNLEIVGRLNTLPANLLAAMENPVYREKIEALLKELQSDTPENRELFVGILGYIILGMLPSNTEELGEDLNAICRFNDIEVAEILADKILDIIDPLIESIRNNAVPFGTFREAKPEVTPKDMAKVTSSFTPPTTSASLPTGLTKSQGGTDKPFFIHTETTFSPVAKAKEEPKTGLSLSEKISSIFKSAKTPTANTAKIGIGGAPAPKPVKTEGIVKTEMDAPRIVHYGEMKTALGKITVPPPTPSGKPAPVSLGAIGHPKPAPVPSAPNPIPAPTPPPAPKPAPAPRPAQASQALPPAAPHMESQMLVKMPGVKGVPPPPPTPPKS